MNTEYFIFTLTLTKPDPVMPKIIDPPDAQLFDSGGIAREGQAGMSCGRLAYFDKG
jgi:hypothetical protein